jgi:hypothetical protein
MLSSSNYLMGLVKERFPEVKIDMNVFFPGMFPGETGLRG